MSYRWTKTYAVNAPAADTSAVGDHIMVEASGGPSEQVVLSITSRRNQQGQAYKTLIVQAV
jgi:hypothetical protein